MPTAITSQDRLVDLAQRKLHIATSPEQILKELSLPEKVFLLSGTSFTRTSGLAKHGLHPAKTCDAATDVRGDTIFNPAGTLVLPNATCLASTWDTQLVEAAGTAIGEEAKWREVDVLLAPTLNLHRDPRGGRNQESYGEDPYLAGKMGAAFAKGVQSQGVAVCAKHLVCNDSEMDRRTYNSVVDEETLRDVYLRPFEIVIEEANPASIMTAYNSINGISAASNKEIMDIIREEWGWDGVFMSDWFGTYDGITSAAAGCDLEMPFPAARGGRLLSALERGDIHESDLDPLCLRVIRFLQRVSARPADKRQDDRPSPQQPETVSLARRAAADGIILLQNNGILPLPLHSTETIGVIGAHADTPIMSHLITPSYSVLPLEGIERTLESAGRPVTHRPGPYVHRVPQLLDHRFSQDIEFRFWNTIDRQAGGTPVYIRERRQALEAVLLTPIPGLSDKYEIEMASTIQVPASGTYIISLTATASSKMTLDDKVILSYRPAQIDIQQFLFYSHEYVETVKIELEADRSYRLGVVTQKQQQTGREPVAQGIIVGMVRDRTREDLIAEALETAKTVDKVVLFVGTTSEWEMEGIDREDLDLPCDQADFVRRVLDVNNNVVVVNQSGAAVDLTCAKNAAAVIHAHLGGQEAGNAIADVLFGIVNPGGRCTFSWPSSIRDSPSYGNFPRDERLQLKYAEGMAMGYRGHKKSGREAAYAFGHGLSYTCFEWSDPSIQACEDGWVEIKITVAAVGPTAGRDVVEIYLHRPGQDEWQSNLEAFVKTPTLAPGESCRVSCKITPRAFVRWDAGAKRRVRCSGTQTIHVARSAASAVFSLKIDM